MNNIFGRASPRSSCLQGAPAPIRIPKARRVQHQNLSTEMTDLEFLKYNGDINEEAINLKSKGLDAKSLIADSESNIILKNYLKVKGTANSWLTPDILSTIECYELANKLYYEKVKRNDNNYCTLQKLCPNNKSERCVVDAINGNEDKAKKCLQLLINECVKIIEMHSDFRAFIRQFA